MKILVAQLNNIVGDIQGNIDKAIKVLSDEKTTHLQMPAKQDSIHQQITQKIPMQA